MHGQYICIQLFYSMWMTIYSFYAYCKASFFLRCKSIVKLICGWTKCIFACRRDVTDPGGDRRRVRHRHLPRDHRQHLRRLRLGSHPEQLSGGDHGDGGLHQLLRHHAAERGECLPPIGDSGAEMRRCMKSDHQIFKGDNKDLQSI